MIAGQAERQPKAVRGQARLTLTKIKITQFCTHTAYDPATKVRDLLTQRRQTHTANRFVLAKAASEATCG